jgi:hypothetical protein
MSRSIFFVMPALMLLGFVAAAADAAIYPAPLGMLKAEGTCFSLGKLA